MFTLWPQSVENRTALRTAIAALAAVLISFSLHLQTPYWSGMTVVVVTSLYTGSIIDKAMMRILGTVAGAFLGFFIAGLIVNSFLLYLICSFLIISVSVYYYNFSPYNYAYLLGALCAFIIISQLAVDPQNAFQVTIWRPVEIGIGVLVSAVSAYSIFPNHLKDNIASQIHQLFDDLSMEFKQLLDCLIQEDLHFETVAESNFMFKKNIRKSVELIGAMRREIGTSRERIDEIAAILDSFYDLARQLHYVIITLPQHHDLDALKSLHIEVLFNAIEHDLSQLQTAFSTQSSALIELEMGKALEDFDNQFKQNSSNLLIKSDFIYSLVHFFIQVNQRFIMMQSLLAHAPIAIEPKFKVLSRTERLRSDPDLIKHSIKAGLSVLLALGFWLFSNWPGGLNGIISSLIISIRKNLYDMTHISIHRVLGCFLGGGVALLSLFVFEMNLFSFILVMFLSVWAFTYFMFKSQYYSYIGLQANIALIISLAQEGGPPVLLSPPLQRLAGIMIGIVASFIVANILWRSDALTVLNRYVTKLYKYLGYNLQQALLVSGPEKSLHDLPNLFWNARGLIESLSEEELSVKKQIKLDSLTQRLDSLVIVQATISHLLATVDKDKAINTAGQLGFDAVTYENTLVEYFQNHEVEGALKLNKELHEFLTQMDKKSQYLNLDDADKRNFLAYLNALIQLTLRVQ